MAMHIVRALPSPEELISLYPVPESAAICKRQIDIALAEIFTGQSKRKVLLIGPCSADREAPVLDYCIRLARLQERVADQLLLLPRVYTHKPRTTGDGYKGMLHQPDPLQKPDFCKGLVAVRRLHWRVLSESGLSTADEMLYPSNYAYLHDILSYLTVGARSVENQEHRMIASGMDIPVGMKNPVGGDLHAMLNAIHTAQKPHRNLYRGFEVQTDGNPLAHAILRGFTDFNGEMHANCGERNLLSFSWLYAQTDLKNRALIVDCNHANSAKQYLLQPQICRDVLQSCRQHPDLSAMVKGFMIESYLEDGCQSSTGTVCGQSLTDPCLGWKKTEQLILELAERIA